MKDLETAPRFLVTVDGPFAETKEQLGGIFVLEAKDLNDAIQLGARYRARALEAS